MARLLLLGLVFAYHADLRAQQQASVATDHWVYEYGQQLALRHRQAGQYFEALPLTAAELASFADSLAPTSLSAAERFWLQRLREFLAAPAATPAWLQAGARLQERAGKLGRDAHSRAALRTQIAMFPDRHVALVNSVRLDQTLRDDPNYLGKRWHGFAGYTEQAYVSLHFGKYLVKFGRDFLQWGRGYDASLLISGESRPLDQFYASVKLKHLRLHYVAAKLNPLAWDDSLRVHYNSDFAERYFSAVRLEWLPRPSLLQLALTQMVLYGGPARGLEWYYLNPLTVFQGEQLNEERKGNTAVALDFVLRPRARVEFYGQFLLDDHQIEHTRSDDHEPTEFGVLLGGEVADPWHVLGSSWGCEYTRVANRTYNSLSPWEKFTHRNLPLAHFLGNDFERWLWHGQVYAGRALQGRFSFESRRHGSGRIDSTFDTPWRNVPAGENYAESFPSGVVERSTHLNVEARWHPHRDFYVAFAAAHSRFQNFENQPGLRRNETRLSVNLWLEKLWWLGLE